MQAVHVLDRRRKSFSYRIGGVPVAVIVTLASVCIYSWWVALALFVVLHTLFWLFDSTWLVGFREVYTGFKGKGIQSVIDYVDWAVEELKDCDNIGAVTIYGSICRHMYHDRSDFDLRIVQDYSSFENVFNRYQIEGCRYLEVQKIPMDLKIVDSQDYLRKEMRARMSIQ